MFGSYQEMYLNASTIAYVVSKRLDIVRYANDEGIKAAARFYDCSKNTVKKWCRRYALKGINGLEDISRKPHNSPGKINSIDSTLIMLTAKDAKAKGKYITVNNIRRKTGINDYSDVTINRYINKATGIITNNKHPKATGGSVEWKLDLLPFQLIQVDIKYLTDIDNLKPYFLGRNLAKYQITARCVATGFPIIAYCDEKSVTYTKMFLEDILHPFLKQFKHLDLKSIKIQTDNGTEFTNKYIKTDGKKPDDSSFTIFIEDKFKKHRTIVPGHCTAQSDVETFHWSIERDCLAWDDITNNNELIKYTTEFIERYRETIIVHRGYSPLEKIKETLDVTKVTFPKSQVLSVKVTHPHR